MTKKITTLEEIRAQVEPQIIDIPGFRAGTIITVMVQPVDLTPHFLAAGLSNPLLSAAIKKAQEGKTREEIEAEIDNEAAQETQELQEQGGKGLEKYLPVIDAVCKEALVQPTWDEITSIRPLNFAQKLKIFNAATGDAKMLQSFRTE